ncbi:volvatoxin A2 precursor [Armillaria gallica]|uniref:Volvatoxin A2 n=1 Tax=Armillaria gallica TaxID=47427 RepID=A0A2H3DXX3_ARMGA|nr:volvatoxin A2 precursor [Armillaria gallica]
MSFKDNFSANGSSASFISLWISTHRRSYVTALAFDQFSKLPETLEPTLTEVIKFVGHSNDPTDTKRFNWKDFKAALDHYPGADLTFDMFKTTVVSQTDPTAVSMVVKKIAHGGDLHELETTIEATFTHLKEKKEKGVADFSKGSSEENSSWEYRAVFAIPLADLSNYFYGLVMTIKLEGDVEDEESWDLRGSTPRNFSATIDLMRLVVTAGLRDP